MLQKNTFTYVPLFCRLEYVPLFCKLEAAWECRVAIVLCLCLCAQGFTVGNCQISHACPCLIFEYFYIWVVTASDGARA